MSGKFSKIALSAIAAATFLSGAAIDTASADDWRGRGRNEDRRGDHDWRKGHHWNNHHKPKRVYYYQPKTKVVYVQPRHSHSHYNGVYYSQVFAPSSTYTETYYYPNGMVRTYTVGGYLPRDRHWHPLNNYVRYGLPSPRRGERWVYNDRDALLISEATSRIVSGLVLAASID